MLINLRETSKIIFVVLLKILIASIVIIGCISYLL